MELFVKIAKNENSFIIFVKSPSWMFDKILNMLLFELVSEVTDVSFLNKFEYQG